MPDRTIKAWIWLDKKGKHKPDQGTLVGAEARNPKLWKHRKRAGWFKAKLNWHLPNKKGMGRSKGNAHERVTARAFSMWLYGRPKWMKRTPLSGGWASGKAGDIILDHEIERKKGVKQPSIYVECRSYKDILQYDLLKWAEKGTPTIYTKWIKEVEKKCDGRFPFLVLKGKGTDPWVMIRLDWWQDILKHVPKRVILRARGFGGVVLFPLQALEEREGEGREFLKAWRESGSSSYIGRLSKRS